jgi:hypothetical protein
LFLQKILLFLLYQPKNNKTMKKISLLLSLMLVICIGNAVFAAVDEPHQPQDLLCGLSAETIFVSGNTFTQTLDFSQGTYYDRLNVPSKVFLYSFTLDAPANVTFTGSDFNGNYARVFIFSTREDGSHSMQDFIGLYPQETSYLFGAGTHFLLVTDDGYNYYNGGNMTIDASFTKANLQTTEISFPFDETLSLNAGMMYYSFTLTSPSTLNVSISNISFGGGYWNIKDTSLYNVLGYGNFDAYSETNTASSQLMPAGTYYFCLYLYDNMDFRLQITTQLPTLITLPFNENITLQASETKAMQFTLTEERFVSLLGKSLSEGYVSGCLINSDLQYIDFFYFENNNNHGQIQQVLSAGTYYIQLQSNKWEGSTTVNLKINSIDASNILSYSEIDYSTVVPKSVLLSGVLTTSSLGYYNVTDGDGYQERIYALMKGFTVSVEAGHEYTISNIANGIGIAVLKNGALTGNLLIDAVYINEKSNHGTFVATESGTLRVLVVLFDGGIENAAYTFKITEGGIVPISTIPELCASATTLTYSQTLSETLSINFNSQTPRVMMELTEGEMMSLQWMTPAKAYKINIPVVNQGIKIMSSGYFCIYLKIAGTYQLITIDTEFDSDYVYPTGEYYIVFINIPFKEPQSSFMADVWVNTAPEGNNLKTLLDNAPLVALPHNSTGNIAVDGSIVSANSLNDYNVWYYNYSGFKVVAKKITITSPVDMLYVRSNFDYVALFEFAEQTVVTPDPPHYEKNSLRRQCLAGFADNWLKYERKNHTRSNAEDFDYVKLAESYGGNFDYERYNYESGSYEIPAGDYWVIGILGNYSGTDYWLHIGANAPEPLTVSSINANTTSIGVNADAVELEIQTLLSLLRLTATLNNEAIISIPNNAFYWDIAPNGQTATLNLEAVASSYELQGYDFATNIQPLVIQISYTGNDIPDNTGISDKIEDEKMLVYSLDKQIFAVGVETGAIYQLFDINGKQLVSGKTSSSTLELNVPYSGVYILRVGMKVAKVPR